MSVLTIGKELNRLSYAEMKVVADALARKLSTQPSATADGLAAVGAEIAKMPNFGEQTEDKHLRKSFTRKRNIAVTCTTAGYNVQFGTLSIMSPSLAGALTQLVDSIISSNVMGIKI